MKPALHANEQGRYRREQQTGDQYLLAPLDGRSPKEGVRAREGKAREEETQESAHHPVEIPLPLGHRA